MQDLRPAWGPGVDTAPLKCNRSVHSTVVFNEEAHSGYPGYINDGRTEITQLELKTTCRAESEVHFSPLCLASTSSVPRILALQS